MAMPSGRRISEPIPVTEGQRNACQQRRHRGHHDGPEAQQAGVVDGVGRVLSVLPLALQRKVDHHDAVLLHNADQQDDADDGNHAQVLWNRISASSAPTPADGSVERIVIGWIKLSYNTPSTM